MLILVGCSFNPREPGVASPTAASLSYADDESQGIRCYRFYGYEGISCVRLP